MTFMNYKKIVLFTCLSLICFNLVAQRQDNVSIGNKIYYLDNVVEVEGRQGIACDGTYYYVSDTGGLYKYDRSWNLVCSNKSPFKRPEIANHFGDIDVFNGEIYCGIEKFMYGRGYNIAISVYDSETLEWKRDMEWRPESGQVEVSGIAVDPENELIWMSDWVDSRYVYAYDLHTGKYHSKMQCAPTPYWCQGIAFRNGRLYFSADDGDAEYRIPDNLYYVDVKNIPFIGLKDGEEVEKEEPFKVKMDKEGKPVYRKGLVAAGAHRGNVKPFREMSDFLREGEIEGLCFDPFTKDLLVLNNRGTRIILGMSQGPIEEEGYEKEIHEVYIYKLKERQE